jgi:tRNA nucleotidyltransferase/poly(A) polymerase
VTGREAAIIVLKRLRKDGFESLFAGGCVRDMLLRRRPKDYDVATSARPGDVRKMFRRTLRVGAKFGVVIVLVENRQVEVAAFRTESGYADGRHPAKVDFATAREDAMRRDFTINGMFYDPVSREVTDYVGGRRDLSRGLVRTIGDPAMRFGEDYLRMLRAVRFSSVLDFRLEAHTFEAIKSNAQAISRISGERIMAELEGFLAGPRRAVGAGLLARTGLAGAIFPAMPAGSLEEGLKVLAVLPPGAGFTQALAALFCGCPLRVAMDSLAALRPSRRLTGCVRFLLASRGRLLEKLSLGQLKMLLAEPPFELLYQLEWAMARAFGDANALRLLRRLKKRIRLLEGSELRPKPLLDGNDLQRLGAVCGPGLGRLARGMYMAQLEGIITTRREAESWVRSRLGERAGQRR